MKKRTLFCTLTALIASTHATAAGASGERQQDFLASSSSLATSREWNPHDFKLSEASFCHSYIDNETKLRACWDPDEILTGAEDNDHLDMLGQALEAETLFTTTCRENRHQQDLVSLQVAVAIVGKVSSPLGNTRFFVVVTLHFLTRHDTAANI